MFWPRVSIVDDVSASLPSRLTTLPGPLRRLRAPSAGRARLALLGLALCAVAIMGLTAAYRHGADPGVALAGAVALLALLAVWQLSVHDRVLQQARAGLAEDQLQMERSFVDARIGMAVSDRTHRWLRVNPALCAMLGYNEEELVGHRPSEFTHPDDLGLTERALSAEPGPASQRGTEFEKRYVTRHGSVIWVIVHLRAARDSRTGEEFYVAQLQDISERKRVQAAFAAERHLLDAFLENIPERVYFKDREGRFLRVSRMLADTHGFEHPKDLIGKTAADLVDAERAERISAEDRQVIDSGKAVIDREEFESPPAGAAAGPGVAQGSWLQTTKLPLRDQDGAVIGTFGISRDITQRKRAEGVLSESEGRWRAVLAHLQEIVVLVGDDDRIEYASPSIQRWLAYAPDELIGQQLGVACHPDDRQTVLDAVRDVTGSVPMSLTHRARHRDGTWHTLETLVVSLRHDPVVQAVMIAATDITDRAELEEERGRLEMERRVSHRLEAVGQLAAGIAHEINTPLQFVGDSVTFLNEAVDELLILVGRYRDLLWLDTPLSVAQRQEIMVAAEEQADVDYLCERIPKAFARTVEGVERVRSIVQAMKRFSHASREEPAPADLNEALETTLAVCRNEYKYVADVELDPTPLPPLTCNVGELNQVFLNLIINAAQAIEELHDREDQHRGRIRISTRVEEDHVVVTIADDGPGIPAEIQDRIYEPFFTTKPVGKGTGQGLALARTIVERHSGTLACRSEPAVGTTFTIRLPLNCSLPEPPGRAPRDRQL